MLRFETSIALAAFAMDARGRERPAYRQRLSAPSRCRQYGRPSAAGRVGWGDGLIRAVVPAGAISLLAETP